MFGIIYGKEARELRRKVEELSVENESLYNRLNDDQRKIEYWKNRAYDVEKDLHLLNEANNELHRQLEYARPKRNNKGRFEKRVKPANKPKEDKAKE